MVLRDELPVRVWLSHFQADELIVAHRAGQSSCRISLDLNRTTAQAVLDDDGAMIDGFRVDWNTIQRIKKEPTICFCFEKGEPVKVQRFSEETQRFYSLFPTVGAPTMMVSGFPMHRIKDVDPRQDTLNKIRALQPLKGYVLDTTMGLGYTAIEAARTADQVLTIELDEAVIEICRRNPWSQELFSNEKIERRIGDAFDLLEEMAPSQFDAIIHDPPTVKLAGELYSLECYRELYRVLRPRGRLFHYCGDPASKLGNSVTEGVVRRLFQAGFGKIARKPEAFGVLAFK